MKLTVLTWLRDASIAFIGRVIELIFRIILFILPLGLYLTLIQSRAKASKISSLQVFTNDNSCWQHIYPGFILVAIDPNLFKTKYTEVKKNIQTWISNNKYILAFLFMLIVVALMVISEVK